MFALTVEQMIAAGAIVVVGVFATWVAKATGRWLGRAITETMSSAITSTVQPQLTAVADRLGADIKKLAIDYIATAERFGAIEAA